MNEENQIDEVAPWLLLAISLAGGALRILLIANKGLRLDETFSEWMASHSVAGILQWTARIDQHPPMYYLLLHYWMQLNGDKAIYLRQLSALFGTGTIPIIYLIGKRLSGALVGLGAAMLLALSPFNIRLAQEARMYTLLALNAALAIYALTRLLTDPRAARPIGSQFREYLHAWRHPVSAEAGGEEEFSYKTMLPKPTGWRGWISSHRWAPLQTMETDLAWVGFIVFSAATLYSHNAGVLFFLACNIFILGLMLYQRIKKPGTPPAFQAPTFWNWVKAQAGILILFSPWIAPFTHQVGRDFPGYGILKPGWEAILQTLQSFLNEAQPDQFGQGLIWTLFGVVLTLGLVFYRKNLSRFTLLASLFAIPLVGELILATWRPVFFDRSMIWITIPVLVVVGAGIAQLRFRIPIIVVLGVLGAINLFSTSDYYRAYQVENWSDPAGFVANFAQKGDLVLFNATRVQIPFDYYFKAYEIKYGIQVEKHGVPVDLAESVSLEPKMTGSDVPRLVALLSGHKTAWLVYSRDGNSDPVGLIPQTLSAQMKLVYTKEYPEVLVQIYAAP